jgi:hypothetical protein
MDGTFVDALVENTIERPVVVKVHGIDRLLTMDTDGDYKIVTLDAPLAEPKALQLATLSGIVGYVKANRDALALTDCVLHVQDHATVSLRGPLTDEFAQRFTFATAAIGDNFGRAFTFGEFVDHERFLVSLMALFAPTEHRAAILSALAGVKDGTVREIGDNGMTQEVTVRGGVHLVNALPVPSPVLLRPYRTFREIEQPASLFVLRLQSGETMPRAALFEADGVAWKLDAIDSIAKFLVEQLGPDSPVTVIA